MNQATGYVLRNPVVILLNGLAQGGESPFDGKFVVEYDPARFERNIIGAHLLTTQDQRLAREFTSMEEAIAYWRALRPAGTLPPGLQARVDGRPDRPLTAFSVEIIDNLDPRIPPWFKDLDGPPFTESALFELSALIARLLDALRESTVDQAFSRVLLVDAIRYGLAGLKPEQPQGRVATELREILTTLAQAVQWEYPERADEQQLDDS